MAWLGRGEVRVLVDPGAGQAADRGAFRPASSRGTALE